MDINIITFIVAKVWEAIPNPPLTLSLLGLVLGLTLITFKAMQEARAEGRFDHNLWTRVVDLVQDNRLRDASAICEIEEGLFPRLYKAGIDAARFSRQDSGDNMTLIIHDGVTALERKLAAPAIACASTLLVSGGLVAYRIVEQGVVFQRSLAPILEAGLYIFYPSLVAAAIVVPAGLLLGLAFYHILRLSSRMNAYRLRLLVALFERAARNSMDPFAAKILTTPGVVTDNNGMIANRAAVPAISELEIQMVANSAQTAVAEKPATSSTTKKGDETQRLAEPYFPNKHAEWPADAFRTLNTPVGKVSQPPAKAAEKQETQADVWDTVRKNS